MLRSVISREKDSLFTCLLRQPPRQPLSSCGVSIDDPSDARSAGPSSSPPRARVAPNPSTGPDATGSDEPSLGQSGLLLDTEEKVRSASI